MLFNLDLIVLRALDTLASQRRHPPERRFVRRARALGLGVAELRPRRERALDWLR